MSRGQRTIASLLAVVGVLFTPAGHADILNVPDDFTAIQDAIDAAVNGDQVVVAPGTYLVDNINLIGKAITLRSTDPTNPFVVVATIIDGSLVGPPVVTCDSGEGSGTVIDGFVITGGTGGMLNDGSSPTIRNCTFTKNHQGAGGGMRNINLSSPTVTNCIFVDNLANEGGGMKNDNSSPTLENCIFRVNKSTVSIGGGMHNENNSNPVITDCTFIGNTSVAAIGGGMYNLNSSPTITNCTVSGNSDFGIRSDGGSNPTVTNSVVCGNDVVEIQGPFIDGGGNIISPYCPPPAPLPPPATGTCLLGDMNGDGFVDITDLFILFAVWGACP